MLIAKFIDIKKALDFKDMLSDELSDECLLAETTMLVNGDLNSLQLEIADQLKRYRRTHKAIRGLRNPRAVEYILFDLHHKVIELHSQSVITLMIGKGTTRIDLDGDHG